ncbi:MAG TPA: hypothetical protein H9749_00920 [Candidatus Acutalibacter stercorigallinarum]|nr:hypothetical protein [Candidatus Acutalibacter stercorigallinarum]
MRRYHRLALAACLAAACLLFLPAPAARAQGVEEAELYEKSGVIETNDTLIGKIPRR